MFISSNDNDKIIFFVPKLFCAFQNFDPAVSQTCHLLSPCQKLLFVFFATQPCSGCQASLSGPIHCIVCLQPSLAALLNAYMHLPFLRIKYIVLICTQYTVEFAYMHTMYCLYICTLLYCIISICTQCTANMHQAVLWTTHIFSEYYSQYVLLTST